MKSIDKINTLTKKIDELKEEIEMLRDHEYLDSITPENKTEYYIGKRRCGRTYQSILTAIEKAKSNNVFFFTKTSSMRRHLITEFIGILNSLNITYIYTKSINVLHIGTFYINFETIENFNVCDYRGSDEYEYSYKILDNGELNFPITFDLVTLCGSNATILKR